MKYKPTTIFGKAYQDGKKTYCGVCKKSTKKNKKGVCENSKYYKNKIIKFTSKSIHDDYIKTKKYINSLKKL